MNRTLLYTLGRPLSPFYSLVMRLRAFLYRARVFRVYRPPVPVISVGNLTLGGSGKTPIVQYLAKHLQARGMKPAIISRGYRGKANSRVNIVSDGATIFLEAADAGDEPRLLAESLPGVPILTGVARKHPSRKAIELGADVLILDDGFQHLAVHRDTDLVLFNTDSLAGNSRVFPGGDLREPVSALHRSHAFILTGTCDRNRDRAMRFAELLTSRFPGHPVFMAGYRPTSLISLGGEGWCRERAIDSERGTPLFAFSGIARPQAFTQTLSDMGFNIAGFRALADHQQYSQALVADLFRQATAHGAAACITTEKDMVKLKGLQVSIPIFALRMEVEFGDDFPEYILRRLPVHPN